MSEVYFIKMSACRKNTTEKVSTYQIPLVSRIFTYVSHDYSESACNRFMKGLSTLNIMYVVISEREPLAQFADGCRNSLRFEINIRGKVFF